MVIESVYLITRDTRHCACILTVKIGYVVCVCIYIGVGLPQLDGVPYIRIVLPTFYITSHFNFFLKLNFYMFKFIEKHSNIFNTTKKIKICLMLDVMKLI